MSHNCGMSSEEHIKKLFAGLLAVGMGGACQGTYEALLEVAEKLRVEFNLTPYQPQGLVDQIIEREKMERALQGATSH